MGPVHQALDGAGYHAAEDPPDDSHELSGEMAGNPWNYHTFLDESLNKLLKTTLRLCHQARFELMAFNKMTKNLKDEGKRRRR